MKKKIFLLLMFITSVNIHSQTSRASVMAEKFLDVVQKNSYRGKDIRWDSVRPAFIAETKGITDVNALKPLFEKLLRSLKDGHSLLLFEEQNKNSDSEWDQAEKIAKLTDKEVGNSPKNFMHYMVEGKYAYINIPPVIYEKRKYVDSIGVQLRLLDSEKPSAWIIDLTENNGGDIMPMIWQFALLLDSAVTYSYVDAEGNETAAEVRYTAETDDDARYFKMYDLEPGKVKPVQLIHTKIPVIILTSRLTASSGEFFAAHFKGQKNVKLVGQKTNGQTSGNAPFEISRNCMVMLTTTVLKDRTGKVYKIGEGIAPDITFTVTNTDPAKKLTYKEQLLQIKKAKEKYIKQAIMAIEKEE